MATKFYFHNATSTVGGTLPTSIQSALGSTSTVSDAVTVNRSMDTTIGTSQTSKALSTAASASAQVIYFTRFVSAKLNQTSVAANTWTIGYADQESNAAANFPVTTSGALRITVYVWKPSNGTKYGNILDGTGPTVAEATTSETTTYGTFSGSAVSSLTAGDAVICVEMIYQVTQGNASSRTDTIYYDGTTEPSSDNAAASTCAAFLSTPETLTFTKDVTKALATETANVSESPALARLDTKMRPLTTETSSISESAFTRLAAKLRPLSTDTLSSSEDVQRTVTPSGPRNIEKAPAAENTSISEPLQGRQSGKWRKISAVYPPP